MKPAGWMAAVFFNHLTRRIAEQCVVEVIRVFGVPVAGQRHGLGPARSSARRRVRGRHPIRNSHLRLVGEAKERTET